MNAVVWICEKAGRRWIQDDFHNPEQHLLKGWDHGLLCGYFELVPTEGPAA